LVLLMVPIFAILILITLHNDGGFA